MADVSVSIEHERSWVVTIERHDEVWPPLERVEYALDRRRERMAPQIIKIKFTAGSENAGITVRGPRLLKGGGIGKWTDYHFSTRHPADIPLWLQDKIQAMRNRFDLPIGKVVRAKRAIKI